MAVLYSVDSVNKSSVEEKYEWHLCCYSFESLKGYLIYIGFEDINREFVGIESMSPWMIHFKNFPLTTIEEQSFMVNSFQLSCYKR